MPDTSGAARIFALPAETAEHYDTTAHEFAWIIASAATRSADELDAVLTTLLTPLLGDEGADEAHVGLALTIRRLALFVRSLTSGAGASTHPLADNLRRHEDLSSVQGEQLVARLETWLQSDGGRS